MGYRGRQARPPQPGAALPAALALLVAILVLACGGPGPTPSGGRTPGPSGSSGTVRSNAVFPLPSIRTTIPGLYTDATVYAVGDEQVALILSNMRCAVLADMIAAGEWREVVRILGPINLGPDVTPPPTLPDTGWLILERGAERMTVQLGGRADCSAWAVRTSVVRFDLSGSMRAAGNAILDQDACRTSAGSATMRLTYAPEGSDVRVAVEITTPLTTGRHALDADAVEVTAARGPLSVRETIVARQSELRAGRRLELSPPAGALTFEPGSPTAGTVSITSTDPLVGELLLDNWLSRDGGTATLAAGFRCHLPSRELTRALAAAGRTPGGSPGPSGGPGPGATPTRAPAGIGAGRLSVTFDRGPDIGTKEAGSADVSCEYGVDRPGAWNLGWGGVDERPGSLVGLLAAVPVAGRTGTSSGAAMTVYVAGQNGDEREYGLGGDAGGAVTFQVSPGSGVVTFDFDGRTGDGTRLTGRLVCPAS